MYLHSACLARQAGDLRSGTLDLQMHINTACDRLEAVDREIEAFLPEPGRRERLLAEADKLLKAYPDSSRRPLLFGILIGVKDIFQVEGMPTRAGSKLDPAELAGPEAECVRLLRQAGALVLGKTMTTEFAYFEPGPTRNPHHLAHTPGGSSSGSAAAVAAGLSPLTLGSQTIGSVNRPAAFCGVLGFKPSYNRISTAGILHFSRSADHVGFFTQDLEGMTLAAKELCRGWREINVNYKPVLGVPRGRYLDQTTMEGLNAFEEQLLRLSEGGYRIIEISALDDLDQINLWHRKLIAAEMAEEHSRLYRSHGDLYRPKTVEIIEEGLMVSEQDLKEARQRQKELRERLETAMRSAGIDLWVSPAAPGPAPEGLSSTGNPVMNLPWTNSGLPSISIPSGRNEKGLPFGLQLAAPFMGDELLLYWSQDIAALFDEYQAFSLRQH